MATVALRHIDSTSHGHPPQILLVVDRTNLTDLIDTTGTHSVNGTVAGAVTDGAGASIRHALRDAITNGHDSRHDAAAGRNSGRNGRRRAADGTDATGIAGAVPGAIPGITTRTPRGGGVVESVWLGPLPASELTLIQAQALVTLIVRGGGQADPGHHPHPAGPVRTVAAAGRPRPRLCRRRV
jgi:hypothetical protein